MTAQVAFVGDIHGEIRALRGVVTALEALPVGRVVFLGDYVNKGPAGAAVIEYLLELRSLREITALCGNHERALLDAVDTGDVAPLLRVGGAPTIRSYVGGDAGADVGASLRAAIPDTHLQFLRSMPTEARGKGWVASHEPAPGANRFAVSAHSPVGPQPLIDRHSAAIDTGCGSAGGVLTALLWPSLDYVQVNEMGSVVRPARSEEPSP